LREAFVLRKSKRSCLPKSSRVGGGKYDFVRNLPKSCAIPTPHTQLQPLQEEKHIPHISLIYCNSSLLYILFQIKISAILYSSCDFCEVSAIFFSIFKLSLSIILLLFLSFYQSSKLAYSTHLSNPGVPTVIKTYFSAGYFSILIAHLTLFTKFSNY